jgi:hypothetical protein
MGIAEFRMFTVDFQNTLIAKYPTWTALEAFLTSEEGGNFRIVGSGKYRVIRYEKKSTDMKSPLVQWMRSTIWDTEANLPVCVSPTKAKEDEQPPIGCDLPLIQDFLDGTMLNLFQPAFDESSSTQPEPVLATRSQIGAGGNFYSQRSFAELFADALAEGELSLQQLALTVRHSFKDVKNVHSYFASFVLQHPEHRVVNRVDKPRAYIVHAGYVTKDGRTVIEDISEMSAEPELASLAIPQYPMNGFNTVADYQSFLNTQLTTMGHFWQGLTFKDANGNRWRTRNSKYLALRSLRGSEALPLDRWLRLRSEGKVLEYLKYYAEERMTFWDFEQRFRALTLAVYAGYVDVHKAHAKKLTDLPKNVSPCVFRLHAHYLEHLKPQTLTVKQKDAIDLVNKMTLMEQKRMMTEPRATGAVV